MIRHAVVYYFSGTGNTEFVSRLVQAELERCDVTTTRLALDFVKAPDLTPYDAVFLGFPVHGYGVPIPVRAFIDKLPPSTSKKALVFSTYGRFSCGAEQWAAELLERRGLLPVGVLGIPMPHNNPPNQNVARQPIDKLMESARAKVRAAIPELLRAEERVDTSSLSRKLISSWLNPMAIRNQWADFSYARRARADGSCTRCMQCVRTCPTGSISLKDNVIQFGETCSSCLRCFNRCPASAIQVGPKPYRAPRYKGPLGDYESPLRARKD